MAVLPVCESEPHRHAMVDSSNAMCVLGVEPGFSRRAACACNHQLLQPQSVGKSVKWGEGRLP